MHISGKAVFQHINQIKWVQEPREKNIECLKMRQTNGMIKKKHTQYRIEDVVSASIPIIFFVGDVTADEVKKKTNK